MKKKVIKDIEEIQEAVQFPFSAIFAVKSLIGSFRVETYKDIEEIRGKVTQLDEAGKEIQELAAGDDEKIKEHWFDKSSLKRSDFQFLTKDQFAQKISGLNLTYNDVVLLEYWTVKE